MTVRPLDARDLDACAAIMSGLPLWQRYGVTVEAARGRFARLHAEMRAGQSRTQVADEHGRVVGFVNYLVRGTFGHSGYIHALGVAASAQARGVGTRLMDAAELEILAEGPNVFLLVTAENDRARRFYERRGYRRIGELSDYVIPGVAEILYRKTEGPIQADRAARRGRTGRRRGSPMCSGGPRTSGG